MNWLQILLGAFNILATAAPEIVDQHWNGNGTDGKINNAVQIVKDVASVAGQIGDVAINSDAISHPHPDVVAAAKQVQNGVLEAGK